MKLAYICAPYSGNKRDIETNINNANETAKLVYYQTEYVPVIPHNAFPWLKDSEKDCRKWILSADLEILDRCDVLIYANTHITPGMWTEIAWALEYNKPVICASEVINVKEQS